MRFEARWLAKDASSPYLPITTQHLGQDGRQLRWGVSWWTRCTSTMLRSVT